MFISSPEHLHSHVVFYSFLHPTTFTLLLSTVNWYLSRLYIKMRSITSTSFIRENKKEGGEGSDGHKYIWENTPQVASPRLLGRNMCESCPFDKESSIDNFSTSGTYNKATSSASSYDQTPAGRQVRIQHAVTGAELSWARLLRHFQLFISESELLQFIFRTSLLETIFKWLLRTGFKKLWEAHGRRSNEVYKYTLHLEYVITRRLETLLIETLQLWVGSP